MVENDHPKPDMDPFRRYALVRYDPIVLTPGEAMRQRDKAGDKEEKTTPKTLRAGMREKLHDVAAPSRPARKQTSRGSLANWKRRVEQQSATSEVLQGHL